MAVPLVVGKTWSIFRSVRCFGLVCLVAKLVSVRVAGQDFRPSFRRYGVRCTGHGAAVEKEEDGSKVKLVCSLARKKKVTLMIITYINLCEDVYCTGMRRYVIRCF